MDTAQRDTEPLRDIEMQPLREGETFRLRLWDTGRHAPTGQCLLAYRFEGDRSGLLFEGADFGCSPMHAIDSDATLASLLSFLTLKPGDTDADYFSAYTEDQMDFAQSYDAECIACEVSSIENGEIDPETNKPYKPSWRNLDSWGEGEE
jgi:hypothetical protein